MSFLVPFSSFLAPFIKDLRLSNSLTISSLPSLPLTHGGKSLLLRKIDKIRNCLWATLLYYGPLSRYLVASTTANFFSNLSIRTSKRNPLRTLLIWFAV